jgi:hypothetical protein
MPSSRTSIRTRTPKTLLGPGRKPRTRVLGRGADALPASGRAEPRRGMPGRSVHPAPELVPRPRPSRPLDVGPASAKLGIHPRLALKSVSLPYGARQGARCDDGQALSGGLKQATDRTASQEAARLGALVAAPATASLQCDTQVRPDPRPSRASQASASACPYAVRYVDRGRAPSRWLPRYGSSVHSRFARVAAWAIEFAAGPAES